MGTRPRSSRLAVRGLLIRERLVINLLTTRAAVGEPEVQLSAAARSRWPLQCLPRGPARLEPVGSSFSEARMHVKGILITALIAAVVVLAFKKVSFLAKL